MNTTDYDELRAAAAREVAEQLEKVSDPHERRAVAEEIRDRAQQDVAALQSERDEFLAAAALADGGVTKELADATGMTFSHAQKIAIRHYRPQVPAGRNWTNLALIEDLRARNPLHREPGIHDRAADTARRYEAARARRAAAWRHLGAAHEAVLTAGGRIRVNAPATHIDFDQVRAEAAKEIRDEFATLSGPAAECLRRAADAVDQAESEMGLLQPERDQALATLFFYTTARGVNQLAGLSRQGARKQLERALGLPRGTKLPPREEQPAAARAAGVPFVEDAAEELPQIAELYEAAVARRDAALEIRNEMLRALAAGPHTDGWSQTKLAEFIGRDVATVNRAVNARS